MEYIDQFTLSLLDLSTYLIFASAIASFLCNFFVWFFRKILLLDILDKLL